MGNVAAVPATRRHNGQVLDISTAARYNAFTDTQTPEVPNTQGV